MSSLTKFLVEESHRKKMREGGGGTKTPLVMRMDPHEDLDTILVSNSKGEIIQVPNDDEEEVLTNFFELEPQNEEPYHAILTDEIFLEGCDRDWGNVAFLEELTSSEIADIRDYFLAYGLELHQIFCGPMGFEALQKVCDIGHPSGTGKVEKTPDLDTLKDWQEEHFVVGTLNERPIFLNEHLGPYISFSADPSFVGLLTRMDKYVSVFVHNPERGVVVVRLDADEKEGQDGTSQKSE